MESNQAFEQMKIDGMTPAEWAKDFTTALEAGKLQMLPGLEALVERIYLTATHELATSWLNAGSREAFRAQYEAAKAERKTSRAS